jgi:hypothetical protein
MNNQRQDRIYFVGYGWQYFLVLGWGRTKIMLVLICSHLTREISSVHNKDGNVPLRHYVYKNFKLLLTTISVFETHSRFIPLIILATAS